MSGTPGAFAATFWQHLERPLRNLCTAHARCVAAGVEDWHEAFYGVLHFAQRRGALHLPQDSLWALNDWIGCCLIDEITQAEAEGWQRWQQTVLNQALRREADHG